MSAFEPNDIVSMVRDAVSRTISGLPNGERPLHKVSEAVRALPGVEPTRDILCFRWNECEIEIGMTGRMKQHVGDLEIVRPWKLVSAPEVVSRFAFDDKDSILTARYGACAGQRLLPVRGMTVSFSETAQQQFRKDMQTLVEHGLMHPYAPRGFAHWLISSGTGTLVLNSWSALRECTASEGADALKRINRLLERGNDEGPDAQ